MTTTDDSITTDWLRANNAIAARIERGQSTPQSRLEHAAREYERAAFSIAAPSSGGGKRGTPAAPAGEATAFSWSDYGGAASEEREGFGKYEQALYGLGRHLERCIQEARGFDRIDVGILRR